MCIIFLYNGCYDKESDYSLIIASNRDEYFGRPAQCMAPWKEDLSVYGGRDLQSGIEDGTWFGVNIANKKIGILLNLPGTTKCDAISRGNIVTDYIRNVTPTTKYFETLKTNNKHNGFILASVEFGNINPIVQTYNNETNEIQTWTDEYLGFSNSVPTNPLKKVCYGKMLLKEVCNKYKKKYMKNMLIKELLGLLKNSERQLPDPQLECRQPNNYKDLSSIFVKILGQYGTRAHTIFILSKMGHIDLIEVSMVSPIDAQDPIWKRSVYEFDL